jgi:tRNA (mo5U34)-methyltransferase
LGFVPIVSLEEAKRAVDAFRPWHHKFEIYPGLETVGTYEPKLLFDLLGLGPEIRGKRVLDVGASNGYFSRELDRLGAEVVAFDYRDKKTAGFDVMEACYGKELQHVNGNIADIGRMALGEFDIVLCLGVIYHLPDPVRALWDLRCMCRHTFFLETYVEAFDEKPAARYYPASSLGGDTTNFWAFNVPCVEAILSDVGIEVASKVLNGDRLFLKGVAKGGRNYKMETAYGLLKVTHG